MNMEVLTGIDRMRSGLQATMSDHLKAVPTDLLMESFNELVDPNVPASNHLADAIVKGKIACDMWCGTMAIALITEYVRRIELKAMEGGSNGQD